jgi:sugar lactone lactonase YvrE
MYRRLRSAVALAVLSGCQAVTPSMPATGAPTAVKVDLTSAWKLLRGDRHLQGLGFDATDLAKVELVAEGPGIDSPIKATITLAGSPPQADTELLLKSGHNRLITLVAYNASNVAVARLRAVADVTAGTTATVTFSSATDAAGRVLDDLYHRITKSADTDTLLSGTDLTTSLQGYVNHFTGFASGAYSLVNPLYFKDYAVATAINAGTLTATTLGNNTTLTDAVDQEYRPTVMFTPGSGMDGATVEVLDLVDRGTNGNALALASGKGTYVRNVAPGLVTVRVKKNTDVQTFDLFVPYTAGVSALDVQLPAFSAGGSGTTLTTTTHTDPTPAVATGTVTIAAGTGATISSLAADIFNAPTHLAWDGTGLLVADGTKAVRKIKFDTNEVVDFIGVPGGGTVTDATASPTDFVFDSVEAIAIDADGNYYVYDPLQRKIYKTDAGTTQTALDTYLGTKTLNALAYGGAFNDRVYSYATIVTVDSPMEVIQQGISSIPTSDDEVTAPRLPGRVYGISGQGSQVTFLMDNGVWRCDGAVTYANTKMIAGNADPTGSFHKAADAAIAADTFHAPRGLAVSSDGSRIWVADSGANRILLVDHHPDSGKYRITTVADTGFNNPQGLAYDGQGHLYVADTGSNRILKVQVN